jgi:hypothetical protein
VNGEIASATRVGVARRCGGTPEARGHATSSRRDRRLRSASVSSHKAEDCRHVERYRSLHDPDPTLALSVPFLAPSLGHALCRGALGHARVRAAHSCSHLWRVPSSGDYGLGSTPWSWKVSESAMGSAKPAAAVWVVATEREVHKHSSDVRVDRGQKYDTQVDIRGT